MFNRTLFILILLFNLQVNSFAQQKDSIISIIRTKYQQIHQNLKHYDTTSIEIDDESTEGGQATGYYAAKKLKLIRIAYFGETGKSALEYYFDNGELFFALEKHYTYNRPIYWDEKHKKENNDTEIFDPAKTIVTEDRYYFDHKKLVRWLDKDKKQVDLLLGTNTLVGQGLIAHAYKIRDKLKR